MKDYTKLLFNVCPFCSSGSKPVPLEIRNRETLGQVTECLTCERIFLPLYEKAVPASKAE